MDYKIYFCQWQHFNSNEIESRILTVEDMAQLLDHFVDDNNIEKFTFEDITDKPIEDYERRLVYNGKYSL